MTPAEKVLHYLVHQVGSDYFVGFDNIAEATELPRKIVARSCRWLRERGYAQFSSGLISEDGLAAGAGYSATFEGVRVFR